MTDEPTPATATPPPDPGQRAATVLGWFAGASLGLMASIGLGAWLGNAYPMVIGNFAGVVLGAFGGMGLADRWGELARAKRATTPFGSTRILRSMGRWLRRS